jgi:hypothetical protein
VLPILTFDEARLNPSHGYIFNRRWLCPHETILGIAWKLARMNALPGHIVAKQLALRVIGPRQLSWPPCCLTTECYPVIGCRWFPISLRFHAL